VTLQRIFIVRTNPPATLPFHTMPGIGTSNPGDLVAQATSCLIKQWAPNDENKDTTTGAGRGDCFQPVAGIMVENRHAQLSIVVQSIAGSLVEGDWV